MTEQPLSSFSQGAIETKTVTASSRGARFSVKQPDVGSKETPRCLRRCFSENYAIGARIASQGFSAQL